MTNTAILKYALATIMLAGGMAISAAAQTPDMVGGYSDAKTSDKEIVRASKVALRDHSRKEGHSVTLVKINKAEKQVVAGMNYRLCMSVRRGRHGKVHTVTAVVYEPIRKPWRLTNWQEGGCKDL